MQVTTDPIFKKNGVKVSMVGLILQLIVFTWFLVMAFLFHRRLSGAPTQMTAEGGIRWKKYFWALYIAGLFTWVRNIVRIAEYAQGFNGFVMVHEFMLYVFDALFMTVVVFLYLAIHPARLVRKSKMTNKFMGDAVPMMNRR